MKILLVPLDERPCNYDYPQYIAESAADTQLIIPPRKLLGEKKISANLDALWKYVDDCAQNVDAMILSMDMLLFGGLIPSRIHHLLEKNVDEYVLKVKQLKEKNPKLRIYASQCIMRCPSYNSSEEEPDYYEQYGELLFERMYLTDKKSRNETDESELETLNRITIPDEIIRDYEWRRKFNLEYNIKIAELVNDSAIDFLVIPQDDSSPYGYTALAQREVIRYLTKNDLESRINIYPGADEVGISLLARCINDINKNKTKVFSFYSSTLGPTIVPLYEDRPMDESLKYHLDVTNSYGVLTPAEADYILAINSPGKFMQESFDQNKRDVTYTSNRNLLYFVKEIERYISQGYRVAICDSAFSNGGDAQLIKYLDERNLLDKIIAYAGWNTNCNTLGTVLGMSIFNLESSSFNFRNHLVLRICEDYIYQAIVRQEIINDYLPKNNLSYYDFKNKQDEVEKEIGNRIYQKYNMLNISKVYPIKKLSVNMPWKRMFEVGLKIEVE